MTESAEKGSTSTDLTRSFITDEWLARAVKLDSLNDVASLFVTDFGFDIFDTERDGIFQPSLIKDKDVLIGVPFAITRWRSAESDKYTNKQTGEPGNFAVVELVYPKMITDSDGKQTSVLTPAVFTDGGVGVAKTLAEVTNRRYAWNAAPERKKGEVSDPFGGLGVMSGLVKSEYDTVIDGESVHGVTYYLDFTPKS
jgi:hypothetical protein